MKRNLCKFICFTAVIGVMLSAVGCSSYRNFEDNVKSDIAQIKHEQEVKERQESKQKAESESAQQGEKEQSGQDSHDTAKPVILDPSTYDEGLIYTVKNAKFYKDFKDTGLDEKEMKYPFESQKAFILMEVSIKNESSIGQYSDGSVNVATLYLLDRTCEEDPNQNLENTPEDLERLIPGCCYFQEHGDGDDYWHTLVEIGEEKTFHFGFSVPVDSQEEAEQYLITWMGLKEVSGDIPFVPEGSDKS